MDKAEAMQISGIALLLCFVTAALTFSALFVIYKEKFEPVFNMGRRLLNSENRSLLLAAVFMIMLLHEKNRFSKTA